MALLPTRGVLSPDSRIGGGGPPYRRSRAESEGVARRYQAEGERLSRLAATTTGSMPALRSYLSGEAAFRAGAFDRAVEEFRRATERDTTFALAWYRLAVAEEWSLDLAAAQEAEIPFGLAEIDAARDAGQFRVINRPQFQLLVALFLSFHG